MPELVAKTSESAELSDSLTVLLDWVNIEAFSGFTIVVENAGGGGANDITDVQIDTSDDGGITASEDQHPGVPAVPIADGDAKVGTFTETAAFVRVRALCAEGEDTTANAHLLADSSSARICTLADVKDRLGISDAKHDITINRIISGLELIFDNFTRRKLIANAADVTEYFSALGSYLQLNRYPVISIASIKQAIDYDFDSADALEENTDYRIVNNGKNGIIIRVLLQWFEVPDSVQVIYRGGFCSAGVTPGNGETALPADLREAAIEQASFIFKRRDDIGLAGVGFQGGSISKFSAIELLPMVKNILSNYKKSSL